MTEILWDKSAEKQPKAKSSSIRVHQMQNL